MAKRLAIVAHSTRSIDGVTAANESTAFIFS